VLNETDAYLASYRGPLLLIWGMRDAVFGPDLLAAWRERFPNAPVVELDDAGHFLQEDRPERIVSAIREFLAER
jgi:haloalkane dehalogenase